MKNITTKHQIVYARLIFLIFILLVTSCHTSINENKLDLQKLSLEFIKRNSNIADGYLIDMLANDHFYGDSIYDIKDSQVVYYYQAHGYIKKYDSNLVSTLEPALDSINLAIRKDGNNSFNHFLKSYLLFRKGALVDAKSHFEKGLSYNKFSSYQVEASFALLNIADFKGPINEVQSLSLVEFINRLTTNVNYLVYIGKNIRKYMTDQNVNIKDKKRVFNLMCEYSNNIYSFEIMSNSNVILYNRLAQLTSPNIKEGACNNESSYDTTKSGVEYKEMVDEYYKKNDITVISKSRYWNNLLTIRNEINKKK
jgi:hypothetical protein